MAKRSEYDGNNLPRLILECDARSYASSLQLIANNSVPAQQGTIYLDTKTYSPKLRPGMNRALSPREHISFGVLVVGYRLARK